MTEIHVFNEEAKLHVLNTLLILVKCNTHGGSYYTFNKVATVELTTLVASVIDWNSGERSSLDISSPYIKKNPANNVTSEQVTMAQGYR